MLNASQHVVPATLVMRVSSAFARYHCNRSRTARCVSGVPMLVTWPPTRACDPGMRECAIRTMKAKYNYVATMEARGTKRNISYAVWKTRRARYISTVAPLLVSTERYMNSVICEAPTLIALDRGARYILVYSITRANLLPPRPFILIGAAPSINNYTLHKDRNMNWKRYSQNVPSAFQPEWERRASV